MLPTGGNPEALEKAKPVLLTFAANAIPVGDHGAGNALKLLNQLMFSCINAISSEVMAICDHVGIDKQVFYDTVAGSSAATVSGLFKEVGKSIVTDGFETPTFTVDLLIKDAKLGLQMAKDADAPSVIAGTVQMYNEIAHGEGLGAQDTSALYKVFSQHYEKLS
jgi:3-hydroxyisobutyrate dehydrogenase-like beta-hydroxyacid dehydrogenase